jgi:chemotaxis protein MotB
MKMTEAEKARLAQEAEDLKASKTAGGGTTAPGPIDHSALSGIVDELKKELGQQAPDVKVTKEGNIEIVLQSDVTFGSGSAELSESGKKSLKALTPLLKGRFAPYQVRIEGHTDATPLVRTKDKYKDNFGLGSARSLAVVRFMESDLAIEPTRLMSASRGEHDPIADDKTSTGRKKNRRVDVVVVIPHDAAMSLAK